MNESTVIGVVGLVATVLVGPYVQASPLGAWFTFTEHQLAIGLPVYGFIAAILPVWIAALPA